MSHWWMIFFTVLSVDADMNLCSCSLQGKFSMDSSGDLGKGICTDLLQKGIRQQCWRLKKLYWKDVSGLPREQALLLKPKEVDNQSWADLLDIWHDATRYTIPIVSATSIADILMYCGILNSCICT
jgi:hypothetical protein